MKTFVDPKQYWTSTVNGCKMECLLKAKGCSSSASGPAVLAVQTLFEVIKGKQNVKEGYDYPFCISCEDNATTKVTKTKDDVSFKQNAEPPCNFAVKASPKAATTLTWTEGSTSKGYLMELNSGVFESSVAGCAISSCVLKKKGCTDAYAGANLEIYAGQTSIRGNQAVVAGYAEEVCTICTDSRGGTINYDSKTYTQTARPPCNFALKGSPTAPTTLPWKENSIAKADILELKTGVFESAVNGCLISQCELKAKGCTNAYAGTHLKIATGTTKL